MNTNTITIGGEHITVSQYGDNDYSIHFLLGDFSVRGTILDIVKAFAEWQWCELDEPVVSFEYLDRNISNPWVDESARFPLDTPTACKTYGEENVLQFIIDAYSLLRPETEVTP